MRCRRTSGVSHWKQSSSTSGVVSLVSRCAIAQLIAAGTAGALGALAQPSAGFVPLQRLTTVLTTTATTADTFGTNSTAARATETAWSETLHVPGIVRIIPGGGPIGWSTVDAGTVNPGGERTLGFSLSGDLRGTGDRSWATWVTDSRVNTALLGWRRRLDW